MDAKNFVGVPVRFEVTRLNDAEMLVIRREAVVGHTDPVQGECDLDQVDVYVLQDRKADGGLVRESEYRTHSVD